MFANLHDFIQCDAQLFHKWFNCHILLFTRIFHL